MKKLLIIALFVLGMCNVYACPDCEAPALDAAQEIILTEVYNIMPLDDAEDKGFGYRPDPNRFYASIGSLSRGRVSNNKCSSRYGCKNLVCINSRVIADLFGTIFVTDKSNW